MQPLLAVCPPCKEHNHSIITTYADQDDTHAPVVAKFQEGHDFFHFIARGIAFLVIIAMHSMDKRKKSVYLSEVEFSGLKPAKTSKTRHKKCFY